MMVGYLVLLIAVCVDSFIRAFCKEEKVISADNDVFGVTKNVPFRERFIESNSLMCKFCVHFKTGMHHRCAAAFWTFYWPQCK